MRHIPCGRGIFKEAEFLSTRFEVRRDWQTACERLKGKSAKVQGFRRSAGEADASSRQSCLRLNVDRCSRLFEADSQFSVFTGDFFLCSFCFCRELEPLMPWHWRHLFQKTRNAQAPVQLLSG